MLTSVNRAARKLLEPSAAPLLIAVGLATLIVFNHWPAPVLTATALIALGATLATIDRFAKSPALPVVLLLHSATYVTLYCLFLGAALHKAPSGAAPGLAMLSVIDIGTSALCVVSAAYRVGQAFRFAN